MGDSLESVVVCAACGGVLEYMWMRMWRCTCMCSHFLERVSPPYICSILLVLWFGNGGFCLFVSGGFMVEKGLVKDLAGKGMFERKVRDEK